MGGGDGVERSSCNLLHQDRTRDPQIILFIPTIEYRGCTSGGGYVPCVYSHAR